MLVASAFGMLQHHSAVNSLVARWRAGPWQGRLDGPRHWLAGFTLLGKDCVRRRCATETLDGSEASRCAHAPAATVHATSASIESPGGLLDSLLRLTPLVPGGRRGVVRSYWNVEMGVDLQSYVTMREYEAGPQVDAAARRCERARAWLTAAGGALASTTATQPFPGSLLDSSVKTYLGQLATRTVDFRS